MCTFNYIYCWCCYQKFSNAFEVTLCGAQWHLKPAKQCAIHYTLYFDTKFVCYWCGMMKHNPNSPVCAIDKYSKKGFFQTLFQFYRRPGQDAQTHQALKHLLYHPHVPHRYMMLLENLPGVKQMYTDFSFENSDLD